MKYLAHADDINREMLFDADNAGFPIVGSHVFGADKINKKFSKVDPPLKKGAQKRKTYRPSTDTENLT